jgi:hypothetical protein
MNKKIITSPQFRHDIVSSFGNLSDKEMQLKEWEDVNYLHAYWDSLCMYIFNALYNVNDLHEFITCKAKVGEVFYTEEEALAIADFTVWFNSLIDKIGESKPDTIYINNPEWPKVWKGAKKCYEIMKANDEKYDIQTSWDIWEKNLTLIQRETLQVKMHEFGFKEVSKEECDGIMREFEQIKNQLMAEWEAKAGNIAPGLKWKIYDEDEPPEKVGKPYKIRHVIPPEQGGVNEWWNIYPSYN